MGTAFLNGLNGDGFFIWIGLGTAFSIGLNEDGKRLFDTDWVGDGFFE